MGFTDAISDAFSKYAQFGGRSSRAAYWWFYLFQWIVWAVALIIDLGLGTYPIVVVLAWLAVIVPGIAVLIRRFHDAGKSGWWVLMLLVPLAGIIVWLMFTLTPSVAANEWGSGPDTAAA